MSSPFKTQHFLLLKLVVLLIVSLLISSCGFQLKQSAAIPAYFGPASIEGVSRHSSLFKAIKTALKQSDITLTDSTTANHRIVIGHTGSDRRVLSVNTTGKVSEYELTKTLTFSVSDKTGNEFIEEYKLSANRSYTVTSTDALGSGLEEDDLHIRMERDLVDRMFRYIAAQM